MNEAVIVNYTTGNILTLAEDLNHLYYARLKNLCEEASALALKLRAIEIGGTSNTEVYTVLCVNFTKHLRQYQEQKIETIVPYIVSLSEKEKSNHNCLNCTHQCQINHTMHVSFLKESHDFAKSHLQRLNNVAVTTDINDESAQLYQSLRIKMFLIESALIESCFLEETFLIPEILRLQKAINILTPA